MVSGGRPAPEAVCKAADGVLSSLKAPVRRTWVRLPSTTSILPPRNRLPDRRSLPRVPLLLRMPRITAGRQHPNPKMWKLALTCWRGRILIPSPIPPSLSTRTAASPLPGAAISPIRCRSGRRSIWKRTPTCIGPSSKGRAADDVCVASSGRSALWYLPLLH